MKYLLAAIIASYSALSAYDEMNYDIYENNTDIVIEKSQDSNRDSLDENMVELDSMPIIDLSQYPEINIKDLLDVYGDINDRDTKDSLNLLDLLNKAKENYILQAKNIAIQEAKATKESIYGRYVPSLDIGYGFSNTKKDSTTLNNQQLQANANWIVFDLWGL